MLIEKELFDRVKEATFNNYKKYMTPDEEKYYVESEEILTMLDDLLCELGIQQEKYEDMEEYYKQHYHYENAFISNYEE